MTDTDPIVPESAWLGAAALICLMLALFFCAWLARPVEPLNFAVRWPTAPSNSQCAVLVEDPKTLVPYWEPCFDVSPKNCTGSLSTGVTCWDWDTTGPFYFDDTASTGWIRGGSNTGSAYPGGTRLYPPADKDHVYTASEIQKLFDANPNASCISPGSINITGFMCAGGIIIDLKTMKELRQETTH